MNYNISFYLEERIAQSIRRWLVRFRPSAQHITSVAKTDVVAEPYVLAGVDAALAPVAREGARRRGRCWPCSECEA